MKYTTVLFDADDTLLDFGKSEREAVRDCLIARGFPSTDDVIARYSEINQLHWNMLERGEISRERLYVERFAAFCRELGFVCDAQKFSDDYLTALSTKSYLIDGALEMCERLSKRLRMYVVTNGNAMVQHGRFDPSPIARYFERSFISEEMGSAKPAVEYFNRVFAEIPNFDPNKTLIVGDSLTSDIQGGINAGIDTCWYNPKRKSAPEGMQITYTAYNYDEIINLLLG
ncbi:MAG: YjjG family noncanonical pyrimidine nucleotidase [Clostridia bacterium]|nr:YjjG family noncanonical pyrimidine nucleotidase [Clostridia bacterium]